jgi:hypothetical protein
MSEVREQTPHPPTLRIQRGKIREWNYLVQRDFHVQRLRLHATFVRLPVAVLVAQTSVCGFPLVLAYAEPLDFRLRNSVLARRCNF